MIYYFCSQQDFDGKELYPRIPESRMNNEIIYESKDNISYKLSHI